MSVKSSKLILIKKSSFSVSTYMYLLKILQSTSMDASIYHEKCKASFKNIKIIKTLRCKFKVTSLHFRQKD